MFASIRSRLWLSYSLVTAAALAAVAVVLLIYIIQNPSTYRLESARLTVVAALFRKNEAEWSNLSAADLQLQIEKVDKIYATRFLLYSANRRLIVDSQSAKQPALKFPLFPRLRPYSILRDQNGNFWLYMLRHLNTGRWLLLAVPRPAVPRAAILSDELMLPVVVAGLIALVISLLAAFWLARWIGDPLQKVVVASHRLPSSEMEVIEPRGPHEVQELTRAFNQMNSRVKSSQRSQREFVANVSHELKTPLTSIQGFAQALLDGTANTQEAQNQAAQVIYNEAGRMHRMVLDLLDLARLDSNTLVLQGVPVNLATLLNNIAEKFAPQAREAGIDIHVEVSGAPVITGDSDRLAQVFTNLVDNGLKFTPAGGRITLRAAQITSGVQVEVTDTGAGIQADALPNIFSRFYQADPSRSGGQKRGAGLGLAIVKEIIKAHGGRISVRSALGMGTSFTIVLPLSISGVNPTVSPEDT